MEFAWFDLRLIDLPAAVTKKKLHARTHTYTSVCHVVADNSAVNNVGGKKIWNKKLISNQFPQTCVTEQPNPKNVDLNWIMSYGQ